MAEYKVVCTTQVPVWQPTSHAHIVEVGTGSIPGRPEYRWTLAQVLAAIATGHVFYTVSPSTGKVALVQRVACPSCGHTIIRSAPDALVDNNLDSLPRC